MPLLWRYGRPKAILRQTTATRKTAHVPSTAPATATGGESRACQRHAADLRISEALLDQLVWAGVADTAKSEILFQTGLDPHWRTVVNSDPDGVDHGVKDRPMLAFALGYVAAHLALDLLDERQADAILTYCEGHLNELETGA